jgi:hypothetical protein
MIVAPTSHHLTVKNGEKDQVLFMSFGLLNRLTRRMGDIDQLPRLAMDTELQEAIIIEVFTTRDEKGNPTYTPTLDEIQVGLDDIDLVLDFVGDHIANFFMGAAEKAQKRVLQIHEKMAKAQAKISALMPTKPGL